MFLCIAMPSKKQACVSFFDSLGVEPEFIDPVLASDLNVKALKQSGIVSDSWIRRVPCPRSDACYRFEIACCMSHIKAAQRIVESGATWAFVFEDDNVYKPGCISKFHQLCRWAEQHHTEFNVINVSPCNSLHSQQRTSRFLDRTQGCTNALLYSAQGAKELLQSIYPIASPIDDWLHQHMPQSFCIHERIFEQHDSTDPMSLTTFVNPLLRKQEYVPWCHVFLVWVCIPACTVAMFSFL